MLNLRFVRFLYLHRKWDVDCVQRKLNMKEIWKDVRGYEGIYQISNKGNVRSLDKFQDFPLFTKGNSCGNKTVITPVFRKGKLMQLTEAKTGYFCVGLFKDKKNKWTLVHRLVADAFLNHDEKKKHVNHKDSNRKNNVVSNLEWCTPQENVKHAWKKGGLKNMPQKTFVSNAKLTDKQIAEIKNIKMSTKIANEKIANMYGVTRRSVDRLIKGESYKWLTAKN